MKNSIQISIYFIYVHRIWRMNTEPYYILKLILPLADLPVAHASTSQLLSFSSHQDLSAHVAGGQSPSVEVC